MFEKIEKWIYSKVGIKNLAAASIDGWREWKYESKKTSPKIFWLLNTCFPWIWNILCVPYEKYRSVKHFLYNGFIAKEHVLQTKLKFGEYNEVDTRILHGNFETLVNFLEKEKAWSAVLWDDNIRKKYKKFFFLKNRFDFLDWRCFPATLEYMTWEMSLTNEDDGLPNHQAIGAKELLDLYYWWKNRPNRKEPYSDDTVDTYLKNKYGEKLIDGLWFLSDKDKEKVSEEDLKMYRDSLSSMSKLEEQYEQEDEDMLIRLIKIRHRMWT